MESNTISSGSRLNVGNDASSSISNTTVKQSTGQKSLGNETSSKISLKEASNRNIRKSDSEMFGEIPFSIFATRDFLIKASANNPKALIECMNNWSSEKMEEFLQEYDDFPEAMFGKLFSIGLKAESIPDDIKLSIPFLKVAINNNAERVVSEILNKTDTYTTRNILKSFSNDSLYNLWDKGLSNTKLPSEIMTDSSFSKKAIESNTQRWFKELNDKLNYLRTSPLTRRSAVVAQN